MPYTITTRKQFDTTGPRPLDHPADTEHAVATLDEAREAARSALLDSALADLPPIPGSAHLAGVTPEEWIKRHSSSAVVWDAQHDAVYTLPEAGGTIGPLPDGTVIVVKPVEWDALRKAAGLNPVYDGATLTIIDVFNAR